MRRYSFFGTLVVLGLLALLSPAWGFAACSIEDNDTGWKTVLSKADDALYRPCTHGLEQAVFTIYNHGYVEVDPAFEDFRTRVTWQEPDEFAIELIHLPPAYAHLESALKEEQLELARNIVCRSFRDEAQGRTVSMVTEGAYTQIIMKATEPNQRVREEILWINDRCLPVKLGTTLRNGQQMLTELSYRPVGDQFLLTETIETNFNIQGTYEYEQLNGIWMMKTFKMITPGKTNTIEIDYSTVATESGPAPSSPDAQEQ